MGHPPDRQKEHHEIAIQMGSIADGTALDVPSAAFRVLKSRFDAHPPSIDFDEFASRRQVGNHDPDLFIAWFPTDGQGGRKAMLLPDQGLAVPLKTFFGEKLSS
jgi:hypothetical protein